MQSIFRKAGITCLGLSSLWVLLACSSIKDAHLKDSTVSTTVVLDREETFDRQYSKVLEATAWEDGIRDLVLQMVRRLPAEGLLTVTVGEFREGRSGGRVPLSDLIEPDISTTMAGVEDIRVLDRDEVNADILITGLFHLDGGVLRINATMKDKKTGAITATGRVLIRAEEIQTKDLLPQTSIQPPPYAPFDTVVEQILTAENNIAPFNVKVWTDKDQFRIGEAVTFYLKADSDCHITLLDQGTSGVLRVIFPNPYQRDNFIHAGKIYVVPDPSAGYEIRVDGPPGIERVKAIATLEKSDQPFLDVSERFNEFAIQEGGHIRDLNIIVTKLSDPEWVENGLEIDILGPDSPETWRPRKMKPKRPEKPLDIIGTPGAIEERENPGVIEPKRPESP